MAAPGRSAGPSLLVWLVVVAALVVSALWVSYSVHRVRSLTNASQELQRERDRLHTEWGQLLLEQSTWGSFTRVERLARERLEMKQPNAAERVVVHP